MTTFYDPALGWINNGESPSKEEAFQMALNTPVILGILQHQYEEGKLDSTLTTLIEAVLEKLNEKYPN